MIVTGGLGFIGKHFVRSALKSGKYIRNFDNISYAADRAINAEFTENERYKFYQHDIRSLDFLPEADIFINFAAESHVDNAITSAEKFCSTNFLGVQNCLELVRRKAPSERPFFVQVSTDEVYGDIKEGAHSETDALFPSNPYAATKAAADMLVKSWGRTYGVRWNIVRPTNNYGQHQYPEKLIPKSTWRMLRGLPAIMHGDGSYIRSWLHVEDTVDAITAIIDKGNQDQIYNISGDDELRNIDVLAKIAKILHIPQEKAWVSAEDRSGQDVRYSLDDSKIRSLGWKPKRHFSDELEYIVNSFDASRFN